MDDPTLLPDGAERLFQRYWRAARAAAYGVTADWASAEDAASEGFFEALRTIRSLQDPNRFGAWLRTIVVRKARAFARSRFASLPNEVVCESGELWTRSSTASGSRRRFGARFRDCRNMCAKRWR